MPVAKKITPIKVALLSFGMSGRVFHAPFLKVSPYYQLSAVWERTKDLSKILFPEIKIYRDLDSLLQDDEIELVIINTPNFTHYEYARKALNARKNVVVEKPFTITVREGRILEQLAKKNHVVLSVYHNRRFDSDFRTIEKVLKSKRLGSIVEAEFRFDRYRLKPGKKLHKELPGPGTGNLYDLGSHLIDQALVLFGWPQKIFADIQIVRTLSQVDDFFDIILFYGVMRVRLHSSYLVLDTLPETVLYGEKGSFIKRKGDVQEEELSKGNLPSGKKWGIDHKDGILKQIDKGKTIETAIASERGNYGAFYDELYQSIRKGKRPPVTAEDAMKVIRIIELAYKCQKLQKVIPVPKEK